MEEGMEDGGGRGRGEEAVACWGWSAREQEQGKAARGMWTEWLCCRVPISISAEARLRSL